MKTTIRFTAVTLCLLLATPAWLPTRSSAADWPMLGRTATHNPFVPEGEAPNDWDVETARNVKWSAKLGSMTCGDPVVANGLVWIGTNNAFTNAFRTENDAAVLACFRETDGDGRTDLKVQRELQAVEVGTRRPRDPQQRRGRSSSARRAGLRLQWAAAVKRGIRTRAVGLHRSDEDG